MVKLTEELWDVASSFEKLQYEQLNSKIRFYWLDESMFLIGVLITFFAGMYLWALFLGACAILSFCTAGFYGYRKGQLLLLLQARVACKKDTQKRV